MRNITGIHFKTAQTAAGETYEVARIWIGGIPFSADLVSEAMERQIQRLAKELDVEITDSRQRHSA